MFIKRFFIAFIFIFLSAYALGYFFDSLYKKKWKTIYFDKVDECVYGKKNFDILFYGDSRVHFGINSFYVDSLTGLSTYNFGVGEDKMDNINLFKDIYLQKNKAPKIVVLSITPNLFFFDSAQSMRYQYFFYLNNPSIYNYLKEKGERVWLMKTFPFLKYSFFDEYRRTSLFIPVNQIPVFRHNIYKGFVNIHAGLNDSSNFENKPVFDLQKINLKKDTSSFYTDYVNGLKKFIESYTAAGSKVVLLYPPNRDSVNYRKSKLMINFDLWVTNINKLYHLTIWKLDRQLNLDKKYFIDDIHLNYEGSKLYSEEIARLINEELKK